MDISTGYKKSKNLQAKWPKMSRISEEVRISIISRHQITPRYHSYSLPKGPKTGMISRLEFQQGTTATHFLESQGQV
jgi:hypothetical protein